MCIRCTGYNFYHKTFNPKHNLWVMCYYKIFPSEVVSNIFLLNCLREFCFSYQIGVTRVRVINSYTFLKKTQLILCWY